MITVATRRTGRARSAVKGGASANMPVMPEIDEMLARQLQTVASELGEQVLRTLQAGETANQVFSLGLDRFTDVMKAALVKQFWGSSNSTRKHRAMFVHLLNTAELESLDVSVYMPSITRGAGDVATDAGVGEELTSEQAAKLLHVSRTHLNTLVAEGKFPGTRTTPGGHRRIPHAEVLAYREQSRAAQKEGLAQMTSASERMGLYDDEMEGIPVRQKD